MPRTSVDLSLLNILLLYYDCIDPIVPTVCWLIGDDLQKVTSDLEEQYTQGMEHRLSGKARSHTGLGFSEPKPLDVVEEGRGGPGEEGKGRSEEDKIKVSFHFSYMSESVHLHIIGYHLRK